MIKQLTQEEIDNIVVLQDEYAKIIAELGKVELSLLFLEKEIERIKKEKKDPIHEKLLAIKSREKYIANELNAKYGEGIIDLETKEIRIDS